MIARYTRPELARAVVRQPSLRDLAARRAGGLREMETAGTVPAGTTAAVRAKAAGKLDPARILEHEERTRHDVIAFLTHVEELAGEPARWLHLGMTSSDVLDASLAIQLVEAADQILAGVDLLRAACRAPRRGAPRDARRSAARTASTPSRSPPAWCSPASTPSSGARKAALEAAREEIAVGKIAGAVGTYANLDPAVEQAALASLGLRREVVPTQIVARDRHAALLHGAGAPRHRRRAAGGHRPPLAADRGRRGDGGVRQGAEGLVGDAAQEEPDPVREPVRHRAPAALVRRARRSRTSRCGTSATSRTRRSSA